MSQLSSLEVKFDAGFALVATSAMRGICNSGRRDFERCGSPRRGSGQLHPRGFDLEESSCYAMPLREGLVLGTPDSLRQIREEWKLMRGARQAPLTFEIRTCLFTDV